MLDCETLKMKGLLEFRTNFLIYRLAKETKGEVHPVSSQKVISREARMLGFLISGE